MSELKEYSIIEKLDRIGLELDSKHKLVLYEAFEIFLDAAETIKDLTENEKLEFKNYLKTKKHAAEAELAVHKQRRHKLYAVKFSSQNDREKGGMYILRNGPGLVIPEAIYCAKGEILNELDSLGVSYEAVEIHGQSDEWINEYFKRKRQKVEAAAQTDISD